MGSLARTIAAQVILPLPRHRRIQREHDKLDVRQLVDPSKHVLTFFPINLDVELPAKYLVWCCVLDDLLWGHGGIVRDHLHGAEAAASLCNAGLAGRMGQARHGRWRHVDRQAHFMPNEGRRQIAFADVDEDARSEKDGPVDLVVQTLADEIVGRGVVVRPALSADLLGSHLLDLVHVQQGLHRRGSLGFLRGLLRVGGRLGQRVRIYCSQTCFWFEILFERAWRVDWVIFFSRIFPGEPEDRLYTAGVA